MLCEHFGRCGGCSYLDISYGEELALKRAALEEILGEHASALGKLHPAPSLEGYRNKMEFAFGDAGKDAPLALGIRKKRSFYEVASPENCILICEDFKKIVAYVTNFFRDAGETFFHRKRHTGALRHLVLRRGEFTGEILVLLSTASTLQSPLEPFAEGLLALPLDGQIVGIMHAVNDGVADAVKNENAKILHGRDYFFEKICGLTFKVSAFSFFQTNSRGAEVLYSVVGKFSGGKFSGALPPNPPKPPRPQHFAVDLYCGTGTIAQIVSPLFEEVVGIEIVEDAITAARENATLNNIKNCKFFPGDALETLKNEKVFLERGFGGEPFSSEKGSPPRSSPKSSPKSTIILDPPRDGLHPKALMHISKLGASRIVYVACKPKSLVRDLPAFVAAGYEVKSIEAVDMFPRTPHLEAIAWLEAT